MTALHHEPSPGALFAISAGESQRRPPEHGTTLTFGRDKPNVDLCIAGTDDTVSRQLGSLTYEHRQWWLNVTGIPGVQVTGERHGLPVNHAQLVRSGDERWPLDPGYTSLVVDGKGGRLHLIEVLVAGADGRPDRPRYHIETTPRSPSPTIDLTDSERLAVVVLAQDYLRGEMSNPRPVCWQRAADHLHMLDPDGGWTKKSVEHRVSKLRLRLAARDGVEPQPDDRNPGDALKHGLIMKLIGSETIGRDDLLLIDVDGDDDGWG